MLQTQIRRFDFGVIRSSFVPYFEIYNSIWRHDMVLKLACRKKTNISWMFCTCAVLATEFGLQLSAGKIA